jgi:CRP/FNR family transcriptional regulator, cyclic AMP receptor protein
MYRVAHDGEDVTTVTLPPVASMLLGALGDAERDALVARLRRRRYRARQVVFNDGETGDCMYLVQSGRFEVSATTHAGHTMTLRVVQPGEHFGELALVHPNARRTGRVVALSPGETLVLLRRDFEELRAERPAIDRLLVTALAERVVRTSELAMELLLPPETRLWRRLAALDDLDPGGPIEITQDALAQLAGTVRPTANRVLRAGCESRVVELGRRSIRVIDRARVHELAHLPPMTA